MSRSNWVANRRIISTNISSGPIVQSSVSGVPDEFGQNRVFVYSAITPINTISAYNSVETKLFLTGIIAGSDYDNLSHNNAISMRAKLKIGGGVSNLTGDNYAFRWGVGLSAYSPQITTETTTNVGATAGAGYSLELIRRVTNRLTNPDTFSNFLVIKARAQPITQSQSTVTTVPMLPAFDNDIVATCSGTYLPNTWYDVRFDLIPTSLNSKVLTAYTSSDNGSTWDQVGTYTVNESMTSQWSSTGLVGINSVTIYDCPDTYSPSPGQEAKAYIGDFKINVDPIDFIP